MRDCNNLIKKLLHDRHRIYPFCITLNSRIFILEAGRKKFILKERYPYNLNNEYRVLNFLQQRDFPYVPRTHGIGSICGKRVMVQEYIEGRKLERDKRLFYEYSDNIALILARLHLLRQQKARPAWFFLDREARSIQKLVYDIRILFERSGPQQFSDYLIRGQRRFDSFLVSLRKGKRKLDYSIKPSLINREMEFVIKGKHIYLLDWENACFGDYAYDIADLRYIYREMDYASFIEVFKKNTGLSENLSCRVDLYLPLIIIKEFFYYILDVATCEFYRNIQPKIVTLISTIKLDEMLSRIDSLSKVELP